MFTRYINRVPYSSACAIEEEHEVTLTGGWSLDTGTEWGYRVIRYKSSGEFEDLPSMDTWRQGHACGHFTNVEGEIVSRYLVAIEYR